QYQAEQALAKVEFERVESLMSSAAVSQSEYDQKKSALAVSQSKRLGAEAAVRTAELNLEYTRIFSPIDGRAGARMVDPGNVVKANDAAMLTIQKLDPIYAEFTINENDLGTVRKFIAAKGLDMGDYPERGLKVMVDVPGDSARVISALGAPTAATQPATQANRSSINVYEPGNKVTPFIPLTQASTQPTTQAARPHAGPREGKLTFLDNAVQSGSGTVRLRATVPNGDHYFWPGQFVNVRLVLTTKKDAVLVPVEAQQIGQQGPFVYVVVPGQDANGKPMVDKERKPVMTADIRPVTPGQRQGKLLVIEQGLAAGEKVIVTGQMMVMPKAPVMVLGMVQGEAPATQAAAQER
ncbi:MAG TPA: hypothetical protein VIL86_18195, partial [Tepidisphaeraceae bacterium]